ncbi:MAG: TRASH domain-containing protein [Armatimonadetes bacterium]|nr:TRASH domain-containing protein [Armatimonadota bacterium]
MQCDYCGQEILGRPIYVELRSEDLGPMAETQAGEFYFCSPDCHAAYMEEAGVPQGYLMEEEEADDEEESISFSDRF